MPLCAKLHVYRHSTLQAAPRDWDPSLFVARCFWAGWSGLASCNHWFSVLGNMKMVAKLQAITTMTNYQHGWQASWNVLGEVGFLLLGFQWDLLLGFRAVSIYATVSFVSQLPWQNCIFFNSSSCTSTWGSFSTYARNVRHVSHVHHFSPAQEITRLSRWVITL